MDRGAWMRGGELVRRLLPLAFALILAGIAVAVARHYLVGERQKLAREWQRLTANYQGPIDVIVAAKDLPEGTTLEPSMLGTASIPEKFVQPYAVRAPGELIGKITIAPTVQGEQVLLTKVRRPDELAASGGLSNILPQGKRAVTIAVDATTGVGGFVRPGDLVDLLWTVNLPKIGQQEAQVVTLTLFQDVSVVGVGPELMGRSAQPKSKPPSESAQYLLTVSLNPQETSLLLLAREQGRIQLSLRPGADKDQKVTVSPANSAALMEYVLGKGAIPDAPKPPPQRSIEVFKGLERSVVSVESQ